MDPSPLDVTTYKPANMHSNGTDFPRQHRTTSTSYNKFMLFATANELKFITIMSKAINWKGTDHMGTSGPNSMMIWIDLPSPPWTGMNQMLAKLSIMTNGKLFFLKAKYADGLSTQFVTL